MERWWSREFVQALKLLTSMVAGNLAMLAGLLFAAEREATPPSSITALPGFQVTLLRSAQEGEGSWISLTFDPQGRIIVGIDDRGLGRLTIDPGGQSADFERLLGTEALQHVRGVLYANDSLYACATDSQQIYRCDTTGDDQFDQVQLLKQVDYRSRYGHGTNQIVLMPATGPWADQPVAAEPHGGAPAPQSLYVVTGNDVSFPEGSDRSRPTAIRATGCCPARTMTVMTIASGTSCVSIPAASGGRSWRAGFATSLISPSTKRAMFTWDADMEWDVGCPGIDRRGSIMWCLAAKCVALGHWQVARLVSGRLPSTLDTGWLAHRLGLRRRQSLAGAVSKRC